MSENNEIEIELQKFSQDIDDWHEKANIEGIWIFLATLGCWGVTNNILLFVALIIVFFIFIYLLSKGTEFKGSFDMQFRKLEKKYLKYDSEKHTDFAVRLREIRKEKLSILKGMLRVGIGTMGIFFWAVTTIYFLKS